MVDHKLYYSPQTTRSARARWAYKEAGLEHESVVVDVYKGEQKKPEYLDVHPLGVVPAAEIEGDVVIESSALAFIAGTESDSGLVPPVGSREWRQVVQWTVFAPAELDSALFGILALTMFTPEDQRSPEAIQKAVSRIDQRLALIERALEGKQYLVGDAFSVADITVGFALNWASAYNLLGRHERTAAYFTRLTERAAFQEIFGTERKVMNDLRA